MRTSIAIAAVCLAACGTETVEPDGDDASLKPITELRAGTYVGDIAYVRDTCDIYGAGTIETTILEWFGTGIPDTDCTALDDGRWRCERWHDSVGDCSTSGYEYWVVEPVTETSMYVEHTIQLTSTACGYACELRLTGTLYR